MKWLIENCKTFPKLKPTIIIKYSGLDHWREQVWIIYDQITGRHCYINRLEYEIVSRWSIAVVDDIINAVNTQTAYKINRSHINQIYKVLVQCHFLKVTIEHTDSDTDSQSSSSLSNKFRTYIKKFSFNKYNSVLDFNPDSLISATSKFTQYLFTSKFNYLFIILFFINLYLFQQQTSSLPILNIFENSSDISISRIINIFLLYFALIFTKIIHELGHMYACVVTGGRLNKAYFKLYFIYPAFYCNYTINPDVSAKDRLKIATAGIRFEIYIAILSGTLWLLLPLISPDSFIFRNLLFFMATVPFITSILIHSVPFTKFDGYYILLDYLKTRSLNERGTNIFRYYIHRYLLGVDAVLPEIYNARKYKYLYRYTLLRYCYYLTILALLLYIPLIFNIYSSIIYLFILLTITTIAISLYSYHQLNFIWSHRINIKKYTNLVITSFFSFGIIILLFVPLTNTIYIPAVFLTKVQRVYIPIDSQITSIDIVRGNNVIKNQNLLGLFSMTLDYDKIINKISLETKQYQVKTSQLLATQRQNLQAKQSEQELQRTISQNLVKKENQLLIKSEQDGKVISILDGLYPNLWLAKNTWVLDIADFNNNNLNYIQAFIRNQDLRDLKLNNNTEIIFIPDQHKLSSCTARIKSIASEPINTISFEPFVPNKIAKSQVLNSNILIFASNFGGIINFSIDEDNNLEPVDSYFKIELLPYNCNYNNQQMLKGILKMSGQNRSLIGRFFDSLYG